MGGPVTVLAAGAMPERTAGVICSDTLHNADFVWPEEMRQGIGAMVLQEGPLREWVVQEMLQADRGMAMAMIREFLGEMAAD